MYLSVMYMRPCNKTVLSTAQEKSIDVAKYKSKKDGNLCIFTINKLSDISKNLLENVFTGLFGNLTSGIKGWRKIRSASHC